jgi:hypothetical protein
MRVAILRAATAAVGLAALLTAESASAQRDDTTIGGRRSVPESPQHFAFELRVAPFIPEVDSDPALGGKTPYKQIFGTHERVLFSAEFDWQAYRIPYVGTIGPGVSVGYTSMSDPAPLSMPFNGMTQSGENTTLEIYPFYGAIVLRADAFWRRWRVPVVPYGKVGLAYALWRVSNTLGTEHFQGVSGTGGSLGTFVAVGVALNLNPLDVYAAREFDESLGVNGSYIFAEFARMDLSGLGIQSDPLRVGGNAWTFGLAFEF